MEAGIRYSSESHVLDPNVLRIGEQWAYFAGGAGPDANHFALSADGLEFQSQGPFSAQGIIMANGVATDDGYSYYGFDQMGGPGTPRHIRSLHSADGVKWTAESGNRLDPNPESGLETNEVKDPTVVRPSDGTYLMIYVTGIP